MLQIRYNYYQVNKLKQIRAIGKNCYICTMPLKIQQLFTCCSPLNVKPNRDPLTFQEIQMNLNGWRRILVQFEPPKLTCKYCSRNKKGWFIELRKMAEEMEQARLTLTRNARDLKALTIGTNTILFSYLDDILDQVLKKCKQTMQKSQQQKNNFKLRLEKSRVGPSVAVQGQGRAKAPNKYALSEDQLDSDSDNQTDQEQQMEEKPDPQQLMKDQTNPATKLTKREQLKEKERRKAQEIFQHKPNDI